MLHKFANETCLHGIPKVINSRSSTRRYIWATLCFLFGILCITQVIEVLRRFSEYPTRTNVELVVNELFPFPSVSVCHTRSLDFHVLNTINRLFTENERPDSHVNDTESHFVREYMKMVAKYSTLWNEYPDYRNVSHEVFSRTTISANIPEEVISSAAIQFNEFFVKCFFGGNRCNSSADFSTFFDSYYYNCFTYTTPENNQSPVSGINDGWSAVVLIGNTMLSWASSLQILPGLYDATSTVAASEGVRVVIHPPDTQPFPFEEGFDVPPGYSASFGVRPRRNIRSGPPHGKCSHGNPFDEVKSSFGGKNQSADDQRTSSYSNSDSDFTIGGNTNKQHHDRYRRISCQKMCLQHHVIAECNCYDTSLPVLPEYRHEQRRSSEYFEYEQDGRPSVKPCRLNEEINDSCMDNATDDCLEALMMVYNRIKCARRTRYMVTRNTTSMEECGCHPPCDEFQYDVSYSLSKWPATGFEGDSAYYDIFQREKFHERFDAVNKATWRNFSDDEPRRETMSDFARLIVYISGDEGGLVVTRQVAEFSINRLVSELGGQLAIWVGVSAIALAELVELFVLMVRHLVTKKSKGSYDPSSMKSMTAMSDPALCSASSTMQHSSQTNQV